MSLIKRKALKFTTFKNEDQAREYSNKTAKKLEKINKSFISVIKRMGISSGRVLDIGTGSGTLAISLCKEFSDINAVGIDISKLILTFARENAEKKNLASRIAFIESNAEDLPFENESFDLVVSSNTLHLIDNPKKMFNEIDRVLKNKGKFFISDFKRNIFGLFSSHIRASYTPKEIKEILKESNLENWTVKNYFFWISILRN